MRYSKDHSVETRRKVLAAAAFAFRAQGIDGAGVDGIAAAAGVTSGAIYRQFGSKANLVAQVVEDGVAELVDLLEGARANYGPAWRTLVAGGHFQAAIHNVAESGVLPTLSADIARCEPATREAYTQGVLKALAVTTTQNPAGEVAARHDALVLLTAVVGGIVIARASGDAGLRDEIAACLVALADQIDTKSNH